MNNITLKAVVVAAMILSAPSVLAYRYTNCEGEPIRWLAGAFGLKYSSVSFSDSRWRAAMDRVVNRFKLNPSRLGVARQYNDSSVAVNNGESEVWFTTDPSFFNGRPAVAVRQMSCIDIWLIGSNIKLKEMDLIFNNEFGLTLTTTLGGLQGHGGGGRSFEPLAMHEVGHAAGLRHASNSYNIMGSDFNHVGINGSALRAYLGEDAANGLVFLYGQASSGKEDLSISQFRRSGSQGAYSLHGRTRIFNTSGSVLPARVVDGWETAYRVNRGQRVSLELTYENNGRTIRTAQVGYYISTNNMISTLDRKIASAPYTLDRDRVYTHRRNLTIPSDLQRNRVYYLGAIIDDNNSLSEMDEGNNAARIPIWIN